MLEKHDTLESNEIQKLSNELTYRRYIMNKGKIREVFKELTIAEYIALHMIVSEGKENVIYGERTYLKDLAEKMRLTIRQTSKLIGELKDRGLVLWLHDGDGSEGTFVTITKTGRELFEEQEIVLNSFYGNIIEKFGKENLIKLLQLMRQLDTIISSQIEEMEVAGEDDRDDGIYE